MKNALIRIAIAVLYVGFAGPALAQNFLDDMIYSVKCSGADDKEACKGKARQEFEDYQQGKKNGSTAATPAEQCQSISAKGTADVDTAYARAIDTFRFQTLEEKTHYGQNKRGVMLDDGYKHVRNQGALYDLWDRVQVFWPERNRTVNFYAGAKLLRNASGSAVSARYCVISGDDSAFGDPAFMQFADESFRKLVQ